MVLFAGLNMKSGPFSEVLDERLATGRELVWWSARLSDFLNSVFHMDVESPRLVVYVYVAEDNCC